MFGGGPDSVSIGEEQGCWCRWSCFFFFFWSLVISPCVYFIFECLCLSFDIFFYTIIEPSMRRFFFPAYHGIWILNQSRKIGQKPSPSSPSNEIQRLSVWSTRGSQSDAPSCAKGGHSKWYPWAAKRFIFIRPWFQSGGCNFLSSLLLLLLSSFSFASCIIRAKTLIYDCVP